MQRTLFALCTLLFTAPALAAVCDYRPSEVLGPHVTSAVASVSTTVFAVGTALRAAGFYTLINGSTGATMLGSTLAGDSAAGTIGIVAGTGKGVGAAAAALMSAPVLITAGVIATTALAYESGCLVVYLVTP
jgi:hypothetical protein